MFKRVKAFIRGPDPYNPIKYILVVFFFFRPLSTCSCAVKSLKYYVFNANIHHTIRNLYFNENAVLTCTTVSSPQYKTVSDTITLVSVDGFSYSRAVKKYDVSPMNIQPHLRSRRGYSARTANHRRSGLGGSQ